MLSARFEVFDTLAGAGALAVVVAFGFTAGVAAQGIDDEVPTFSRDIAPILQESCQSCHNQGGMGPMSFMTYEEVRPWAPIIKHQTTIRHMPPWHIDTSVGIQSFKNDSSLSDEEIRLIARWADAGAPEGDPADLPSPLTFDESDGWKAEPELGRPPDLVLKSEPFTLGANVQDQWWEPVVRFEGILEDRYLMAAEFKPAAGDGLKVVHHGHAVMRFDEEDGPSRGVARYGVGKSWEMFPEGVGMRIPAGPGEVLWNIHYAAIDNEVVDDVVEVGLWFYPEDVTPSIETQGEMLFRVDNAEHMRGQDILIPPHGYQVIQGTHVLESAAIIHSVRPHMHTRGKTMTIEALYPDGRKELLSQINNYDHNWQNTYIYDDHVRPLLPAGTVLLFTSVFDNTAANPINPDPDNWVVFGRRGPDEMNHMWVGISYVPDDQLMELISQRQGPDQTADR
jgi:hypothetical protein